MFDFQRSRLSPKDPGGKPPILLIKTLRHRHIFVSQSLTPKTSHMIQISWNEHPPISPSNCPIQLPHPIPRLKNFINLPSPSPFPNHPQPPPTTPHPPVRALAIASMASGSSRYFPRSFTARRRTGTSWCVASLKSSSWQPSHKTCGERAGEIHSKMMEHGMVDGNFYWGFHPNI